MPAKLGAPRWFMDENSLGPAKALQHVRGDMTWPGQEGGPVPAGALDPDWLPVIGRLGLVVLTRDKRIRRKALERQALLDHGVRACFLTGGGTSTSSTSFVSGFGGGTTSKNWSGRDRALARQRDQTGREAVRLEVGGPRYPRIVSPTRWNSFTQRLWL